MLKYGMIQVISKLKLLKISIFRKKKTHGHDNVVFPCDNIQNKLNFLFYPYHTLY